MCDIDQVVDMLSKWLPPITETDKVVMSKFLNAAPGTEEKFTTLLLKIYIKYMQPYLEILGFTSKPREDDCAASGIIFFYGCLIYTMHFPGWAHHIENIFLYNILYILVDHYIDDINVDDITKQKVIDQMKILVNDPSQVHNIKILDPCLSVIALVYEKLLRNCPQIKPQIVKLFELEIQGVTIQNVTTHSKETYYEIASLKGGQTMLVLQSMVGNTDVEILKSTYELGTMIQLIDDSQDILMDSKNKINTIATHEYSINGNLDHLWMMIGNMILSLNGRFNIFKILFILTMMYLPNKNKSIYSESLISKTNKYNLFELFTDENSLDNVLISNINHQISKLNN
jgi:hypothetical protein